MGRTLSSGEVRSTGSWKVLDPITFKSYIYYFISHHVSFLKKKKKYWLHWVQFPDKGWNSCFQHSSSSLSHWTIREVPLNVFLFEELFLQEVESVLTSVTPRATQTAVLKSQKWAL